MQVEWALEAALDSQEGHQTKCESSPRLVMHRMCLSACIGHMYSGTCTQALGRHCWLLLLCKAMHIDCCQFCCQHVAEDTRTMLVGSVMDCNLEVHAPENVPRVCIGASSTVQATEQVTWERISRPLSSAAKTSCYPTLHCPATRDHPWHLLLNRSCKTSCSTTKQGSWTSW